MKEKIYYFIVLALLLTCNCFAQFSGHRHTYYYVLTERYENDAPAQFSDRSCYYTFSNEWCYYSNADGRVIGNTFRYRGNKDGYKWYSTGYNGPYGWHWFSELHLFVTSDNSEIREVIDLSSQAYVNVRVLKRSDPSNNRSSGSNNSPTYTPRTYTPPPSNNERRRVERTCTSCNGTGLYYDLTHRCSYAAYPDGCKYETCPRCSKSHCIRSTIHESCFLCDGTGKRVTYEY